MSDAQDNQTWITDEHGNRASVEYWGSEEAARESLKSLVGCADCTNCRRCQGCHLCTGCNVCMGCSCCIDCFECVGCTGCHRSVKCFSCSGCSGCTSCEESGSCHDCDDCSRCYNCRDLTGGNGQSSHNPKGGIRSIGGVPVPKIENIHRAVYEAASKPEALDMLGWHVCETTHCRAGWVVHLAGKAGYALERATSPLFAAMQIYKASGYEISPVRFFDTRDAALADMKRLAEAE